MLQTVAVNKNNRAVVRIDLATEMDGELREQYFLIRPDIPIPKKKLKACGIEQTSLLRAHPFYDVADDLIDAIGSGSVRFLSIYQYRLFVGEYKTIGYNCQLDFKTLDSTFKRLQLRAVPPLGAGVQAIDGSTSELLSILAPEAREQWKDSPAVVQLYFCYAIVNAIKAEIPVEPSSTTHNINQFNLNQPLLRAPGVYYFKNAADEVIYVGKAKRLKNRLQSHFANAKTGGEKIYTEVNTIDLAYTGSDLIAQLLESHEIKNLTPKFNKQQVKTPSPYEILIKKNKAGIKKLVLEKKTYSDTESERFYNRASAKKRLQELCSVYELCPKFCSLERIAGPCIASKTGNCRGVCDKNEDVETYNLCVEQAYKNLMSETNNAIIKVPGRTPGERGFVLITNGVYQGFGFYGVKDKINTMDDLEAFLHRHSNNYDTIRIIDSLLKKIPKDRMLSIEDLGW